MIKKWLFPFPAANGKEITDPNAFYAALAGSDDGFFPIGANGLWHGGVHFGAGTSGALKQDDGIRCIADGEVVAYRLDQRYPEIQYPSGGGKAAYSTGFVLVRHKLVLPPPPSPPGNASSEAAAPPPADDVLVFFSLYMHLLDKAGYDSAPHLKRPKYWGGPAVTYAVGGKAKDKEPALAPGKTGLRIRNAAHEAAGLLPTGAIIKLGAASAKRPAFNELASVISGAEGGKVPDSTPVGYVFKAELDPIPEPDAAAVGAVYVLPTPIPVAAGALMGHIGNYQNFDDVYPIPARGPRPLVHLEVFTGADLPAFLARSRARAALLDQKQRNRLLIDVGAQVYEPIPATGSIPDGMQISASSDSPKSGRWAKAKVLVPTIVPRSGLGAYQASTKTYQYQEQRVIFTGRFVGAADNQVTTNEAEAKRLGYARREVMLPSGDAFWVQRSDLGSKAGVRQKWDKFPLQLSQPGLSTINTSRVLTKADLEKIPAIDRALDANGRQWWKLNRVGWICERDQAKVAWKSPWDWAGFELVEETSRPADLMARDVHHLGGATGTEAPNFKQRADNVDGGPLLSKVRQAIDKQGVVDGVLTRQEFRRALSLPWLADRIGRLIVRYESEWGGDMSKWDELDALMMEGKADWRVEKQRIKELAFLAQLGSIRDFLGTSTFYYWHAVGLISNFKSRCSAECSVPYLELVLDEETVYRPSSETMSWMLATERYMKNPYVPSGNTASGITIGYGYDLGHQTTQKIRQDLNGLYSDVDIEKFVGVVGKKKEDARKALDDVGDIEISEDNALKLAARMKKTYAKQVVDVYPEAVKLHPHCQGALLSLVVNRGNEVSEKDRRKEMLEIQNDLKSGNVEQIPSRLRSMKRLWENTGQGGLITRREEEALFFEKGLKCECWE